MAGVQPLNAGRIAAPRVSTPRLVLTIMHPGLGPELARFFQDNWRGHLDRWSPPAGPRLFDPGHWTERAKAAESEWLARLYRIMANYLPENTRSARLLERLGFQKEGLARDYLFIDGAWRDHVLAALTNPDHDDATLREGSA